MTRIFLRALSLRCPACGSRGILSGLSLKRACPSCGRIFEREPGAVTGAMYLVAILGQLAAAVLFALLFALTDWSVATKLAVGLPVLAAACLWALPVSRALWAAVDYATDLATGAATDVETVRREGSLDE